MAEKQRQGTKPAEPSTRRRAVRGAGVAEAFSAENGETDAAIGKQMVDSVPERFKLTF